MIPRKAAKHLGARLHQGAAGRERRREEEGVCDDEQRRQPMAAERAVAAAAIRASDLGKQHAGTRHEPSTPRMIVLPTDRIRGARTSRICLGRRGVQQNGRHLVVTKVIPTPPSPPSPAVGAPGAWMQVFRAGHVKSPES